MSRATSTGSASDCSAAPASCSSMMTLRISRMLRRAFKFTQQQIVEVVAGGFGHGEPDTFASSGPTVAANCSCTLARAALIVIDENRETLHAIENWKIGDAASIQHRPRWPRAEHHAGEASFDAFA